MISHSKLSGGLTFQNFCLRMSTSPEPESSTFPKFSSTVISNIKLSSDRLWRMFLLLQKFWKVSPLLNLLRTITIVLTFENVYRSRARVLAFSKVSHKVISDRRGLLRIFKDQHYSWVHILNWVASRLENVYLSRFLVLGTVWKFPEILKTRLATFTM